MIKISAILQKKTSTILAKTDVTRKNWTVKAQVLQLRFRKAGRVLCGGARETH